VKDMKKIVCKNCGVVNEIPDGATAGDDDDWLPCIIPEGFEWNLPAGKITPIIGAPIYISGFGEQLSYQAYLDKYGIDPEIAYNLMRGNSRARSLAKTITIQSQAGPQASAKPNGGGAI
jgi:hypothetical protein